MAAEHGGLPAPHLLVETVRRPDVRFIRLFIPLQVAGAAGGRLGAAEALVQAGQEVHRGWAGQPARPTLRSG